MKTKKSTLALPPSIRNDRLSWLVGEIWQRPHSYNTNFSCVLAGKVGSGKSWCSLSLAEKVDRDKNDVCRFDIDRVAFSSAEFAALVMKKNLPVGSAICFDDCGLHLFSRESMVKSVKEVAKIFQCCRYRRQMYFLSLPALSFLDRGVRMLLTAYLEPIGIDYVNRRNQVKFQWMQTDAKAGKIYFHRPVFKSPVVLADGYPSYQQKTIDSVWFDSPSKQLVKDYEKRKEEVMNAYLEKAAARLNRQENPEKVKRDSFESIYYSVSKSKEDYCYANKSYLQVDATKIVLRHGCNMRIATQIAGSINKELSIERLGVKKREIFGS